MAAAVTLDVLLRGPISRLDPAVSSWARSTGLPAAGWERPLRVLLDHLVAFGEVQLVVPLVLVVLSVLCWRERTLVPLARLAAVGLLVVVTVSALKVGIGRPPPPGLPPGDAGRSYPSGHAATAVALWGLLAALVAGRRSSGMLRRVTGLVGWFGPLATMTGMLVLDYHWLTDLLGGAAIGVAVLGVVCGHDRRALGHWPGARRGSGTEADGPARTGRDARGGLAAGSGRANSRDRG